MGSMDLITLTPTLSPRGRGRTTAALGRATRAWAPGFTLLELIAVLVLISAMLALAAPSLRRFARGRETTDAATHLLALAHLARSQAAAGAQVWRLNVDPDEGTYWLTVREAGLFVQPRRDYGRLFRFPDNVVVRLEVPETQDDSDTGDAAPCIQFYPDGRSDPAVVELEDTEGRLVQVVSPSATERFRIETPTEETRL
jgi:prepilin-type N-terminal cleavage/methylation domain-containing protein